MESTEECRSLGSRYRVKYPNPYCPDGQSHYYLMLPSNIWRCERCWAVKWIPGAFSISVAFTEIIRKLGLQQAYQTEVGKRPKIAEALALLDSLRPLKGRALEEQVAEATEAVLNLEEKRVVFAEKKFAGERRRK